jgi:peptidoglycan-N-acetylglucosamine deacetylase
MYEIFRFPYLKEGNTKEKRDEFRQFLKEKEYRNGYVTIDASDWYINSRLLKKLREDADADITPYKDFYLRHIYQRAEYYNELALKLTGRQISHTLLLHHNLTSALFVGDLIQMFEEKGWEVINAKEAFNDPVYLNQPGIVPAGESLIWAMAKATGAYEDLLRYPAEDSRYEEPEMNALGL